MEMIKFPIKVEGAEYLVEGVTRWYVIDRENHPVSSSHSKDEADAIALALNAFYGQQGVESRAEALLDDIGFPTTGLPAPLGEYVGIVEKALRAHAAQQTRELREALELLIETIEAHDIESLSCDNDGEKYCDCLKQNARRARAALGREAKA